VSQKFRISILGLIALFFISTTGLTVYEHYCAHDGAFSSIFIDIEHQCTLEEEAIADLHHTCCMIDMSDNHDENTKHFNDNCCEEDVLIYQIDSDLIVQNSKIAINNVPFFCTSLEKIEIPLLAEVNQLPTANSPPFILPTTELLAQLQRYLL